MNKKIFFAVLFCILHQFSIHVTAQEINVWPRDFKFSHPPIKQPIDASLDEIRKKINSFTISGISSDCLKIEEVAPRNRLGVCYHYAMRKVLNLSYDQFKKVEQRIIGVQDWVTVLKMPYEFFNQVEKPSIDNLVTYTFADDDFNIRHFGIIMDNNKVISKIGISPYVYRHRYWYIPHTYGNNIRFWKLQDRYNTPEGKLLLFETLMSKINKSTLATSLKYYQDKVLQLINVENEVKEENKNELDTVDAYLRRIMGLQVNFIYSHKNMTLLMYAIQKKQNDFITLFLDYGADINMFDENGYTPLMYAVESRKKGIVKLLLRYNPLAINVQNKNGYTALSLVNSDDVAIAKILLEKGATL
ncbi:MAG TPA: ankyrin repeat domain-containing protein [Candidatus Babeliales bacterium]|nr:ankyrin repeat domain-containing protein [Candidatus Babeliales bacterium]